MAVIDRKSFPTIVDVAKRTDPDGDIARITELLSQTNAILEDMVWFEGNLPTGHRSTVRTALPQAEWRKFNSGVAASKSGTAQIDDACGMLETYAHVDKDLAMLNGNTQEFMLSENRAFLEAMNQEMAYTLFHGNTALYPEQFKGLAPRYYTINEDLDPIGKYVLDAGGIGDDLHSIYLCGWGRESMFGIYPKGSNAGLQFENKGQETVTDDFGKKFEALVTHYQWKAGLVVKDYRYGVRIANIKMDEISAPALIDLLIEASELIENKGQVNPVIYMARPMRTLLRQLIVNKSNVYLNYDNVEGKRVFMFDDIPVKICEVLEIPEPRVV